MKKRWAFDQNNSGIFCEKWKGAGGVGRAWRGAEGVNKWGMCQEDREGRKRRVTRRRVSHIPGLMHGAIDSSLLPAHSLHFKESMEAGRRGRRDGGRRGGVYECVCVKKGGGRVALNSWVDVNKAVTVWMVILSCYLCSLLSLSLQPPSSLATSGQHLLSSFTSPRPPSLCNPPPPPLCQEVWVQSNI